MEDFILLAYFLSLTILFGFGIHGLVMLYYYHKTQKILKPVVSMPDEYPVVTIQLPMYNELYVIERLIRSVCNINYPVDKLEIQVLDDSTDESREIASTLVKEYQQKGFDIKYIHRTNREGYKAGALKAGLETARGEFVGIFDAVSRIVAMSFCEPRSW